MILWDDVPVASKRRLRHEQRDGFTWNGLPNGKRCGAAVAMESYLGERGTYRRCDSRASRGGLCYAHAVAAGRIEKTANDQATMVTLAGNNVWRSRPAGSVDVLRWFRLLTDDDILSMRNVGVKQAAVIREMRDTWSDERVRPVLRLPVHATEQETSSQRVEAFFAARPDVFAVLGG